MRYYADKSVYLGLLEQYRADVSSTFFERLRFRQASLVISDLLINEVRSVKIDISCRLAELKWELIPNVTFSQEAQNLVCAYYAIPALPYVIREDAEHFAMATTAGAQVFVSWDIQNHPMHNRVNRMSKLNAQAFNAVNSRDGYGTIELRSPLEVVSGEQAREILRPTDERTDLG